MEAEDKDKFFQQVASAVGLVTGKTYKSEEIEVMTMVIDSIRQKGGSFSLDDACEIRTNFEKKAPSKAEKVKVETSENDKKPNPPRKKFTPVNDLEKRVMQQGK